MPIPAPRARVKLEFHPSGSNKIKPASWSAASAVGPDSAGVVASSEEGSSNPNIMRDVRHESDSCTGSSYLRRVSSACWTGRWSFGCRDRRYTVQ